MDKKNPAFGRIFNLFDDAKVEGFEKFRCEVPGLEIFIVQQGDMERDGSFDTINYKFLQGSFHSDNNFLS